MSKQPIFVTRTETAITGNILDAIEQGDHVTINTGKRTSSGTAFERRDDHWLLRNGDKLVKGYGDRVAVVDGETVETPTNIVSVERVDSDS